MLREKQLYILKPIFNTSNQTDYSNSRIVDTYHISLQSTFLTFVGVVHLQFFTRQILFL